MFNNSNQILRLESSRFSDCYFDISVLDSLESLDNCNTNRGLCAVSSNALSCESFSSLEQISARLVYRLIEGLRDSKLVIDYPDFLADVASHSSIRLEPFHSQEFLSCWLEAFYKIAHTSADGRGSYYPIGNILEAVRSKELLPTFDLLVLVESLILLKALQSEPDDRIRLSNSKSSVFLDINTTPKALQSEEFRRCVELILQSSLQQGLIGDRHSIFIEITKGREDDISDETTQGIEWLGQLSRVYPIKFGFDDILSPDRRHYVYESWLATRVESKLVDPHFLKIDGGVTKLLAGGQINEFFVVLKKGLSEVLDLFADANSPFPLVFEYMPDVKYLAALTYLFRGSGLEVYGQGYSLVLDGGICEGLSDILRKIAVLLDNQSYWNDFQSDFHTWFFERSQDTQEMASGSRDSRILDVLSAYFKFSTKLETNVDKSEELGREARCLQDLLGPSVLISMLRYYSASVRDSADSHR